MGKYLGRGDIGHLYVYLIKGWGWGEIQGIIHRTNEMWGGVSSKVYFMEPWEPGGGDI